MSINDFVLDELKRDQRFKKEIFWTVDNHEKYSTLQAAAAHRNPKTKRFNQEIFELMCSLNSQGLSRDDVCADHQGQGSLRTLVSDVGESLSKLGRHCRVHYVELGPEPIKTTQLVGRIAMGGVQSLHYTAIDVNETSKPAMRAAIEPLVEKNGGFRYVAADYRHMTRESMRRGHDITVITMLGFQEGNELPVTTGRLIRDLADDSTYVLSEMQLYDRSAEEKIFQFYEHPDMLRFSELVALQKNFVPNGPHSTTLVRLKVLDEQINVAVTLQPVGLAEKSGYLLTNICIKYTRSQFRRLRVRHGNCRVVEEFTSGDGSVHYQMARFQNF